MPRLIVAIRRISKRMNSTSYIAQDSAKRLDVMLSLLLQCSRAHAQKLINDGHVTLRGAVAKVSSSVNVGDIIVVSCVDVVEGDIQAEDIAIDIVYQDADVAVINKAQGMIVHPASGVYSGTLVNALLYHVVDLSGINGVIRPGIVHRIDKDTSGLLVVAKNDNAHNSLADQLLDKTCGRVYLALVEGVVKSDSGTIDKAIARSRADRKKMAIDDTGKSAVTHYTVLQRFKNNTLVQFVLSTGRTHQIRVHAQYMGHPVVGDKQYGYKHQRYNLEGQLLHATQLTFVHPTTRNAMTFHAPLPPHFQRILTILEKEKI